MLWYCVNIVKQQAVRHRRTSLDHTTTTSTDTLAVISRAWFVTRDYDVGGIMDLWRAKFFTALHSGESHPCQRRSGSMPALSSVCTTMATPNTVISAAEVSGSQWVMSGPSPWKRAINRCA